MTFNPPHPDALSSTGRVPQSKRGLNFGFFFDYDMTYAFVSVFQSLSRRLPKSCASGFVLNNRYYEHAVHGLPKGSSLIKFYDLVEVGGKNIKNKKNIVEIFNIIYCTTLWHGGAR